MQTGVCFDDTYSVDGRWGGVGPFPCSLCGTRATCPCFVQLILMVGHVPFSIQPYKCGGVGKELPIAFRLLVVLKNTSKVHMLQDLMASPPQLRQITEELATSPNKAAATNPACLIFT